jgi:tetratricopeptide (TPR) repeat protein
MIHAALFVCLLFQAQATEANRAPEVVELLRSGLDDETQNNLDEAITEFRKAADLAPSDAVVFFWLGEAYMKKRDYVSAISPLKHAAELSPNSVPVNQLLGFALLTAGYASDAIPPLEKVQAFGALGIAQLQVGRAAEAVANLQKALENTPNDPDLLYYLSRASGSLSSQSLDKLLSAFPNTARGHQALGQSYYAAKMYAQAVKEYQQALALRPDLPGLRLELGQIYAASSDWENAEKEFREETRSQPGSAEVAYRLGDALLQQGKMKEAAEELQRSDQLLPNMPETLYALGKATAVSDPADAERALGRVLEIEKDTFLAGQAYLTLAAIHRKQGKTDQATHDMQEYRRIQSLTAHLPE